MDADPDLELALASGSPRRVELLSLTGWRFVAKRSTTIESPHRGEDPKAMTQRLARAKAAAATEQETQPLILAADTLVIDQGLPLGKPKSLAEAREMLMRLRGREHRVVTSIALVDAAADREVLETCVSQVPMRNYHAREVEAYLATGSPLDKAGAYGIQDGDFSPVDRYRMGDCFANVMGLPLCHLVRAMQAVGVPPRTDVPAACQAHTGYECPVHQEILGTGV